MEAVNYSDLRQNLKTRMNQVYNDHEPLIVTRKNNENIVLISLNDYNSLVETHYLLSNPKNTERILSSLKKARNGKTHKRELIEE